MHTTERSIRSLFRLAGMALATVWILALPAAQAALAATEIRFATIAPQTFPYYAGMAKFKETIEKKHSGKVSVKLFHSGQMGDERKIEESILQGSVHIGIGAGAFAGFAPIMDIVELPFLIKNQAHMEAIATGPIGKRLAGIVAQQSGFLVLAWFSTGDSTIQTTKVPVRKPEDLKGIKIRTMPNKAMEAALKAMDANPTPLAYLQVYTGLKQGVIEGSTVDWMSIKTQKFYESLKYATNPDNAYLAEPRPVIVSKKWFGSLPADVKKAVQDSLLEAAAYQRKFFLDEQTKAMEEMKKKGMAVTDIDVNAFLGKMKPVWESYAKTLDESGKSGSAAQELVKEIIASRPK